MGVLVNCGVLSFVACIGVLVLGCKDDCQSAKERVRDRHKECGTPVFEMTACGSFTCDVITEECDVSGSGLDTSEYSCVRASCEPEQAAQDVCIADCAEAASCEGLNLSIPSEDRERYLKCINSCAQ